MIWCLFPGSSEMTTVATTRIDAHCVTSFICSVAGFVSSATATTVHTEDSFVGMRNGPVFSSRCLKENAM